LNNVWFRLVKNLKFYSESWIYTKHRLRTLLKKIEQQKKDKEFAAENLFVKPIEKDIDTDTWLDMTPEERLEYNEKRYASSPLLDFQHQPEMSLETTLEVYTPEEERLSAEKKALTKFKEQLIELQDLIKNSTHLNGQNFEIQDFNLESILNNENSAATTQLDVWINTLKNYPDVTSKFFDAMQFSSFYLYKDSCLKWISDFVTPEDKRAALSILDRLDNAIDDSAIKTEVSSPFKALYAAIDDIKKHGKSTGENVEVSLAKALKCDLYRLEIETDPEAREQRKAVFLTRLHSMDDWMSKNRNYTMVKHLKTLVEAVAFVFQYAWATFTSAPEKPSFFDKPPEETQRQKRVGNVDKTFESVEPSKNKDKPSDADQPKPEIWEFPTK